MKKYKKGVLMLVRLIVMSIVVLGIMNCVESNPADSTGQDNQLIGTWKIIESELMEDQIWFTDITKDGILNQYTYINGDSVYYFSSFSYEIIPVDTLKLSFVNTNDSTIIQYNNFQINGDTLITSTLIFDNDIIQKYIRYDGVVPPSDWPDSLVNDSN